MSDSPEPVTLLPMKKNHKKQIIWAFISLLLALMSIWAVLGQSKEMSFQDLGTALLACKPGWLLLAILCMFGYIAFEGLTIWYLLKHCGYTRRVDQGILYASADIYCAAITPSATGGQPVCAWFMLRDGIPMGFITAILALYLIAHTFATLVIGFLTVILNPASFGSLTLLAKFLVILGYLTVTGLAALFVCLLKKAKQIERIGGRIIDWLTKKGWVKQNKYWKDKLHGVLSDYSSCLSVIRGKGQVFLIVFAFALLQRLSQTIVPSLVYLAQGGTFRNVSQVFASQIYSAIGSMCMPIPGGMGIADYLLFNGLNAFLDKEAALQLELLSRSCSFYLCVAISLLIVIIGYIQRHRFYFRVHDKN